MNEIIEHLNDIVETFDSKRAKNNLVMVLPFDEQIIEVKNQPIIKYLNLNRNRDHTKEIIKSYLYGETVAFDDILQSLQEVISKSSVDQSNS